MNTSLNGGTTRPLTAAAWTWLASIAESPRPLSGINPGIRDRLTRTPDPLCERVDLPSPFRIHRGAPCPHLRVTDAGRAALSALRPETVKGSL